MSAEQPPGYPPTNQPPAGLPTGEQTSPGSPFDSRFFAPPTGFAAPPISPPPPVPPRNNRRWLLIGGGVAVLLLCCCVVGVLAFAFGGRLVGGVVGDVRGAQSATDDYFGAIRDHDWTRAYNMLDATTRAGTSSAALQRTWTSRETANGAFSGFGATNSKVSTNNGRTTATIVGTVRYSKGTSETKTILLVKENGNWRLASLP